MREKILQDVTATFLTIFTFTFTEIYVFFVLFITKYELVFDLS